MEKVIIHRWEVIFCDDLKKLEMNTNAFSIDEDTGEYIGKTSDIPRGLAENVAALSPYCAEYYQMAMAILYQYEGKYKRTRQGTENPVLSIQSLNKKNRKYCSIWPLMQD